MTPGKKVEIIRLMHRLHNVQSRLRVATQHEVPALEVQQLFLNQHIAEVSRYRGDYLDYKREVPHA